MLKKDGQTGDPNSEEHREPEVDVVEEQRIGKTDDPRRDRPDEKQLSK